MTLIEINIVVYFGTIQIIKEFLLFGLCTQHILNICKKKERKNKFLFDFH